jgi:hypothetical protein
MTKHLLMVSALARANPAALAQQAPRASARSDIAPSRSWAP